jgi:hypothetical protein
MGDIEGADVKDEIRGKEHGRVIILLEGTGGAGNPEASLLCEALEAKKEPRDSIKDCFLGKASVHVLHISTEEEERGVFPKNGLSERRRRGCPGDGAQ